MFDRFSGAVLVTSLSANAWLDAPNKVDITPSHTTDPLDGGPSLAERLLASIWSNSKDATLLKEYQVSQDVSLVAGLRS